MNCPTLSERNGFFFYQRSWVEALEVRFGGQSRTLGAHPPSLGRSCRAGKPKNKRCLGSYVGDVESKLQSYKNSVPLRLQGTFGRKKKEAPLWCRADFIALYSTMPCNNAVILMPLPPRLLTRLFKTWFGKVKA